MKESAKSSETIPLPENVLDLNLRRVRFKGAMDDYEPGTDSDGKPEMHVGDALVARHHLYFADCWCEPTLEYNTEFVRVFRHRSLQ